MWGGNVGRWTGDPEIADVLRAAEVWRDRCLLRTGSAFSDKQLWTLANLKDLYKRFAENPLEDDRDFVMKFQEQLTGAPPAVHQLAAEALWVTLLFPSGSVMKADTKRDVVQEIWEWSKEKLPNTHCLSDASLSGVGHPGTAY